MEKSFKKFEGGMMFKKICMLTIFIAVNMFSQSKSYYTYWYEGDVAKGFMLKCDQKKNMLYDTLYFIDSSIQDLGASYPRNTEEWKSAFSIVAPVKVPITSKSFKGNELSFISGKGCRDDYWTEFSFTGKIDKSQIKGILVQKEGSSYPAGRVYKDKHKVTMVP